MDVAYHRDASDEHHSTPSQKGSVYRPFSDMIGTSPCTRNASSLLGSKVTSSDSTLAHNLEHARAMWRTSGHGSECTLATKNFAARHMRCIYIMQDHLKNVQATTGASFFDSSS